MDTPAKLIILVIVIIALIIFFLYVFPPLYNHYMVEQQLSENIGTTKYFLTHHDT